ncbi:hypothetical protein BT93_L5117 [Corymbia citriodora subsp. variegata]|uniref:LYC1 C-terminal domain-containing protein n=1 Tax=Corymbia citriodora subsp. variegata TaxID=360336 RepID=A0A8T0CF95_CORYI|nr:hypothetical protein BT93_L5117 [Corymbia citriodora subsp. variegata]
MPAVREQLTPPSAPVALDVSQLPNGKDESLVLLQATSAEYLQTQVLNSGEWSGFLDLPAYLDRETHLLTSDLTKKGRSTAWILTSLNLPANDDGTRQILAACETICKDAYVALDGKLDKIVSHGICSVFCRSEYRGRGYAARMISELGKQLESWQQSNGTKGTFSTLYSDIGTKFYSKLGWQVYPSDHITLPSISQQEFDEQARILPSVRDLTFDHLKALPLVRYTETQVADSSKKAPSTPQVAYAPTAAIFQWHFMREEFLTRHLNQPFPVAKGAIHEQSGIALIWARTYANNPQDWHLSSLHIVIPPEVELDESEQVKIFASLLLRAQLEAQAYAMQQGVEIWNPPQVVLRAAELLAKQEVKVITRDEEHLCSLRWNADLNEEVVWLGNEKYAWC